MQESVNAQIKNQKLTYDYDRSHSPNATDFSGSIDSTQKGIQQDGSSEEFDEDVYKEGADVNHVTNSMSMKSM